MRFLALLAFVPAISFAAPVQLNPDKTEVTWHAEGSGSSALKINAKGGHVWGTLEDDGTTVTGELKVKVAEFDTGIDLRNEHMLSKPYLDAEHFPWAVLTLTKSNYRTGEFQGVLTLKGVGKPVHGKVKVDGKKVTASFTVNLADYREVIEKPTYLHVGIQDNIDVAVEIEQ